MNFPFFICIASFALFSQNDRWEETEFVWNLGLSAKADRGMIACPQEYFKNTASFDPTAYDNIQSGAVVWLKCSFVSQFCREVLGKVQNPFVLIITDGDESFPSNCEGLDVEDLLRHDKVLHVFAQNCDYQGKSQKISPLPIGIDFHSIAYKGKGGMWGEKGSPKRQERRLMRLLRGLKPTRERLKRAYVDFHHSDTMHGTFQRYLQFGEDRKAIYQTVLASGLVDHGPPMRRSELWRMKGRYAFSISPHGNGLDCHRTWEDLALGCIVIVKSSSLDPLYEGLPVVIVRDWSEITDENLSRWLERYADAFMNPRYREKLTNRYWLERIRSKH